MEQSSQTTNVLAIDFGTKYLGLASGDTVSAIAMPLKYIRYARQDKALAQIAQLCIELKIDLLLIGNPLGLAGKPTQIANLAREFATKLEQTTGIKTKLWDETGTTQQALSGLSPKKRLENHSEAARIILQEYLEFMRSGI